MRPSDSNPLPAHRETVLVVEDNQALRDGLAMNLKLNHYAVLTAASGEAGMTLAFEARPDLIVLDILLPDWSGLDILSALRARGESVAVLILSAQGSTDDKVASLKLGADDYMTKPFDLPELLARIEALLRRRRTALQDAPEQRAGNLVIAPASRSVTVKNRAITLSVKEFDLLCLLAECPRQVCSRERIIERVWGWDYDGTERTVDNYVSNLRRKLGPPSHAGVRIRTVPKIGYALEVVS